MKTKIFVDGVEATPATLIAIASDMEFVDSQGMTIEQVGKWRTIISNQWLKGYSKGEETIDLDESEYEILD